MVETSRILGGNDVATLVLVGARGWRMEGPEDDDGKAGARDNKATRWVCVMPDPDPVSSSRVSVSRKTHG